MIYVQIDYDHQQVRDEDIWNLRAQLEESFEKFFHEKLRFTSRRVVFTEPKDCPYSIVLRVEGGVVELIPERFDEVWVQAVKDTIGEHRLPEILCLRVPASVMQIA